MNDECVHFSKWTYKTIWFSLNNKKYYTCHLNDINNLLFAPNITWAMVPTRDDSAMIKKKAYARGGKVAMYNQGGMVKSTGVVNTGIKKG